MGHVHVESVLSRDPINLSSQALFLAIDLQGVGKGRQMTTVWLDRLLSHVIIATVVASSPSPSQLCNTEKLGRAWGRAYLVA